MIYEMKLFDSPYEKIRTGKKTVELRLYDEKRALLKIGDKIVFTNITQGAEKLAVVIKNLYMRSSFAELFSEIPPEKCGFERDITPKMAGAEMRTYYSEEQEKRFGVLGIEIELIDIADTLSEKS